MKLSLHPGTLVRPSQPLHCMVAGTELEKHATCYEVSNETQHRTGLHPENWSLPTTLQLHFFALHNVHLDSLQTLLDGSSPKVMILEQLPLL